MHYNRVLSVTDPCCALQGNIHTPPMEGHWTSALRGLESTVDNPNVILILNSD